MVKKNDGPGDDPGPSGERKSCSVLYYIPRFLP